MPRVDEEVKKQILADFHAGKTQKSLARSYNVSSATINKLCKGLTPKNTDKVNALVYVTTELSTQSEREVNAVLSEVNDKLKQVQFFNNATIKNISTLSKKITEATTVFEHLKIQEAILKGKETVLGKAPDTAVQVNVKTENQTAPSKDEYLKAREEALEKY